MSRRPACTPVGKDASKGRLEAVLAAGLAHHGRPRPAPTDAPKRELNSDSEDDLPLTERPAYKRNKRPPPPPPPNLLGDLPPDLIRVILSYTKGMSCEEIKKFRKIDTPFREMLKNEEFWKWQCQLRGYDREDRLFRDVLVPHYWTLPLPAPGTAKVPYHGSWQEHYEYWCLRQLNNTTLRAALNQVIVFGGTVLRPPHIHPDLGPIASWDVSQVTDMSDLFKRAVLFTGDLSKWDVSNVTNMKDMFYGAVNFNADLSRWNVSRVTNMEGMFGIAVSFTGDLSKWDVSRVTNMEGMFETASRFTGDLSKWDVSKVTNMEGMFSGTRLPIGGLSGWDVSSVEIMGNMFQDTSSFNGDLSTWDVSSVTDMYGMFQSAESFNGNISNWDVSNVIVMSWMFEDAISFNGDLSRWDVRKVEVMENMFEGATSYNPLPGYGLGERSWTRMEVG
jgi:surface protein